MPDRTGPRSTTVWLALATMTSLAGCAGGTATPPDPCLGWTPIRPSSQDVLTPNTARQILAHDEHGADVCGWRQ